MCSHPAPDRPAFEQLFSTLRVSRSRRGLFRVLIELRVQLVDARPHRPDLVSQVRFRLRNPPVLECQLARDGDLLGGGTYRSRTEAAIL
jgi:hypothetical protein